MFRAMFEHDMEEKKNSAVNVEDVESDAMASMLHFIYTGGRVDRGGCILKVAVIIIDA